jgi:hypothetical protein
VDSGVGPAGGQVQFTMQFFEDRDHDGVIDTVDRCPTVTGKSALGGCLPVVKANATMFVAGSPAQGAKVLKVAVIGDRGAIATVRCGGRCDIRSRSRLRGSASHATARFAKLIGRRIPNGSTITITVTRPGAIGQAFVWRVKRGSLGLRSDYCTSPGSTARHRSCQ